MRARFTGIHVLLARICSARRLCDVTRRWQSGSCHSKVQIWHEQLELTVGLVNLPICQVKWVNNGRSRIRWTHALWTCSMGCTRRDISASMVWKTARVICPRFGGSDAWRPPSTNLGKNIIRWEVSKCSKLSFSKQ